ncbi:zinc finger protein 831 [Sarcophilus harrisii]|uniref:Zinc finger protein 831 n=1 Tax=Sarcophilus harrisii TaxID=9305 RepID=A0A7N4V2E5_SARHA|nr:zinc finger protein 831 [Sarcophilus harrisii]XP_031807557.1 zinc finger protein 831 [Sarcophilus harrisii]
MEVPPASCTTIPATNQPVQTLGLPASHTKQPSPHLTGPVILQPEQSLPPTVYLKALTIPLYHPVQSGCFPPSHPLVASGGSFSLDSSSLPLILSPLLHSERTEAPQPRKPPSQTLTVNIVGALPVLSPAASCSNTALGSPGKSRNAGKYLCQHCGRDCLKPSVLEKHIRSHTGERPFPCTTCGIAFKTQSNLYKHRRTQTHINNTRLSSESDGSSLLEEGDRLGEALPQASKTEQSGEEKEDAGEEDGTVEITSSPGTQEIGHTGLSALNSFSFKSLEVSPSHGPTLGTSDKEIPLEPPPRASPGLLPAGVPQRWKMQEQRSPTASKHSQLQRQQATYSEKHWDFKVSEGKLKKCESTDSGYLSRSDSVEQQVLSSSPLHSLSEHSVESENETPPGLPKGMASAGAKGHPGERATALILEKKKLEEHISKLISHNKAVVDDTQLDNVRPRKTILSKQGSIDLPMPYTYKDSFHFDIRSLNTTRKKNITLCSVKSTFTPLEKSKPLFFHSVPTQFSTTVDCVPVTRSNSLPFVEGSRTFQDKGENPWASCLSKPSPSPGSSHHLQDDSSVPRAVDFPSSHPRALVRQAAVEDLPLSHPADSQASVEEHSGGKKLSGEGSSVRCKVAGKKFSQKKLKMFSQEKWQMYGDETFKKIYQKMKTSQSIKKPRETKLCDMRILGSDTKETEDGEGMAGPRDTRASTCGAVISNSQVTSPLVAKVTESDSVGHQAQAVSLSENLSSFAEPKETSQLIGSSCHPRVNRAGSSPTLSWSITSNTVNHIGSQDPLTAPNGRQAVVPQMPKEACASCPHALSADDRKSFTAISQDSSSLILDQETVPLNDGEDQERCQRAQMSLRLHSCSPGKTLPESEQLPSERKKLKVEELNSKKNWVFLESEGEGNTMSDCSSPATSAESRTDNIQWGEGGLDTRPRECSRSIEDISEKEGDSSEGSGTGEAMSSVSDAENVSLASFSAILGLGLRKDSKHSSFCDSAAGGTRKVSEPPEESHFPSLITATSATSRLAIPQKENAFSPKYILQLPQEDSRTELSITMSKEQQDRSFRGSKKIESLAGSLSLPQAECAAGGMGLPLNSGTSTMAVTSCLPPRPSPSISTLPELASGRESPKHTQPRDERAGTGDPAVSEAQAAEEAIGRAGGCSPQAPEKVPFASVYTSSFLLADDIKREGQLLRHLHSGSTTLLVTTTSGRRVSAWDSPEQRLPGWERGEPSSPGPQHPREGSVSSPRSLENTSRCHSFESFYCHALPTPPRASPTWPQVSPTSHSGSPRSLGARGSFPSLSAEPRLTWCCLSRSLPLPAEQKEKAHSVYSSLHICDNNSGEEGASSRRDFLNVRNTAQAVTDGLTSGSLKTLVSSLSWGPQKQKLSRAIGAGRVSGEKVSEPKKKREVPCRRGKAPTNLPGVSNKQKRKIHPKRYKRGHLQGCAHLKASRLWKQHWLLRKQQFASTQEALEEGKTCSLPSQAGPDLQGKSSGTISELSLSCEDDLKSEDNSKNNSGNFSHSDLPPSASEHGDPSVQNTTTTSELPLQTHRGLATAKTESFAYDSGLHTGLLLSSSQHASKHISTDSASKSYLDPLGPSYLDARGIIHHPDAVTSGSAISISLRPNPNHKALRIHSDESQAQGSATSEPLSQNIPNREPGVVGKCCSPLSEKPSPASRAPGSASMGTTGKTPLEAPVSGLSTSSLHQVAVRPQTFFSTSSYYSCGEKQGTCTGGRDGRKNQETGMVTVKENIVAAGPGESSDLSAVASKTLKKRSLEGMRKQTRVEYSDTSSDDEDRLVIEL